MRRLIIVLACAAAVSAFSLAAAAGASAHPRYHYGHLAPGVTLNPGVPQPARFPSGTWRPARNLPADPYVCTYLNGSECEKGNGSFNNVTINTSASTWTFQQAGACNYCYMIDSSANNCQFEKANTSSDHGVQDGANPCDQSKSDEVIEAFTGNGRCTFYNTGRSEWYGVWHLADGSSVEGWQPQKGFDTGWQISNYNC